MNKDNTKRNSKLFCSLEGNRDSLFFSLVDYRNNYFTSDDPRKIVEFYNGFESREQLIQWMRERPKGAHTIYEVEGDKDIIVVIPTADFNGKFAKGCRENIFKGLHIVFVESGGKGDFYFNFAHNVNVGIKKAMEYNPKWIVISNDDMYKIDNVEKLRKQLLLLDEHKVDAVFTQTAPDKYHSKPAYLGIPNVLGRFYLFFGNKINFLPYDFWSYLERKHGLMKKFKVNAILLPRHFISKIFFKNLATLTLTASFSIFSARFIKEKEPEFLNECYVNGAEDWEISYEISHHNRSTAFIDYLIGEFPGGTLGSGPSRSGRIRAMRDVANVSLFNYLHGDEFNKGKNNSD
ncbi:MAG: hypothetical protein QW292_03465 [Candidatus Parvarchaeota archaeon]